MDIREKSKPLVYLVLASVAAVVALLFVMGDRLRPTATGQQTAAVESTATQAGEEAAPAQDGEGQQAAVETDQAAAPEQAEAAGQQTADEAANAAAKKPTFDIVRVEEDGAAVIAGQAEAGAKITLRMGEMIVGTAVANERGEWVVTPEKALPKGAHNLVIASEGAGGVLTYSDQVVSVAVPEDGDSQPLIVLSEAEQPSKVLQKPQPAEETEVAAVEAAQEETAAVAEPEAVTEAEPPAADAEQPASEPEQAAEQAVPEVVTAPLVMQAVDYNNSGDIVFSGTAAPGETVRIYVDNLYAGSAVADALGNWAFHGNENITPGVHSLRIDQVRTDGKVAQRRELPFKRAEPAKVAELTQSQQAAAAEAVESAEPAGTVSETGETETAAAGTGTQTAGTASQASDEQTDAMSESTNTQQAATSEQTASALQSTTSGRVVIQPGNNLWNISRVIYGRGIEYSVIYEANKQQIRDPHWIYPGQILDTPGVAAPEEIDPKRRTPLNENGEHG